MIHQKINDSDYVISDGIKTITWNGLIKRQENLRLLQIANKPKLRNHINYLGYDIVREEKVSDGWKFVVKDRRATPRDITLGKNIKTLYGDDDNSNIYEGCECGGKGFFSAVPDAKVWYKQGGI